MLTQHLQQQLVESRADVDRLQRRVESLTDESQTTACDHAAATAGLNRQVTTHCSADSVAAAARSVFCPVFTSLRKLVWTLVGVCDRRLLLLLVFDLLLLIHKLSCSKMALYQ